MSEAHPNERTCYVTGIHDKVTKPLLEELFIQMGPLEKVVLRPEDEAKEARRVHRYALIIFNDEESVPFAVECMDGIRMFGLELSVRPKKGTEQEKRYREKLRRRISNASMSVGEFHNQDMRHRERGPMRAAMESGGSRRGNVSFVSHTPGVSAWHSATYHETPYSRRIEKRRVDVRTPHSGQQWASRNLQQNFSRNDWNAHSPIPALYSAVTSAYGTAVGNVWTPQGTSQVNTEYTTSRGAFRFFGSAPDLSRN